MKSDVRDSRIWSLVRWKPTAHFVLAVFLLSIAVLTGCSQANGGTGVVADESTPKIISESRTVVLFDENAVVALYEKSIQAVVKIQTFSERGDLSEPFGRPPFRGQGSGFIIDREGHILTNNHVIEGVSEVRVILYDDRIIDAKVVGTAPDNDLALLKIDKDELRDITPLPLGNSDDVKTGQMAIALGSPFGLDGSITVGVVSGQGRSIPGATRRLVTDIIQTDAAINPGNSGGPLLNSRGEVIGINTARDPSSNGIGFAVSINTAKSLLPALVKGGTVRSPWLGISGRAVDRELAVRLGLSANKGVYVVSVIPRSPAEKAGLRGSGVDEQRQPLSGGDTITSIDSRGVSGVEDIISYFNTKKVGDSVLLSIRRGEQALTIEVILGEWPDQIP